MAVRAQCYQIVLLTTYILVEPVRATELHLDYMVNAQRANEAATADSTDDTVHLIPCEHLLLDGRVEDFPVVYILRLEVIGYLTCVNPFSIPEIVRVDSRSRRVTVGIHFEYVFDVGLA